MAIIIRHHGETDDIRQILDATGANINENKSHALVLGARSQTVSVMNIKYEDNIKILRFKMSSNTKVSAKASWETLIAKIRAQAAENYHRALNLESRIRYVNEVLLATAWYTAWIFPPPTECVRQINAALSYFIWKGTIFKVPLSTLQKPKDSGGRALIHIMAKCMTLFILRMESQKQQPGTFTTDWINKWNLKGRIPNPPDIKRTPVKLDYLYRYNIEAAYMPTRGTLGSQKTYKKLMYRSLLTSIQAAAGPQ